MNGFFENSGEEYHQGNFHNINSLRDLVFYVSVAFVKFSELPPMK